MRRTISSIFLIFTLLYSTLAAPPLRQSSESYETLAAKLAAHIAQPRFTPASWGIKIVSLDSGKTIFEHNAEKYFNPASNAKLYTGALALDRLGGDFKIKTSIYALQKPDAGGTLKGDLLLYGRGDPTLAARLNEGNYDKPIERIVEQIKAAGVRKVEGDLVGDESYFNTAPFGSGWEWDDLQEYYGAEVSALSIHDNSLDLFVKPGDRVGQPCRITTGPQSNFLTFINRTQTAAKGAETSIKYYRPVAENIVYVSGRLAIDSAKGFATSVAVHNPALLFVTLVKEGLAKQGITITGHLRTLDPNYREVTPLDLSKYVELGYVESPPMKDIVREMLKPSQNLYAQLLLLQVGINGTQSLNSGQPKVTVYQPSATSTAQAVTTDPIPVIDDRMQSTEQRGLDMMTAFLNEAGVKKGDVLLEEGSGLSRKDIVTPNATVAVLKYMDKHKLASVYKEGLPIAGVDGTLERRMRGTAAEKNVHAKTGTLRFVYALSGYVTTGGGERLAFSIMLNNYFNPDRTIAPRDDLDAIPIMLATFGKPVSN